MNNFSLLVEYQTKQSKMRKQVLVEGVELAKILSCIKGLSVTDVSTILKDSKNLSEISTVASTFLCTKNESGWRGLEAKVEELLSLYPEEVSDSFN